MTESARQRRARGVRRSLCRRLRPGHARPRRGRLRRRGRRPGRAASTWPRPGRPGCGSRSSPTTRRGRRRRSPSTCASWGWTRDAGRRGHLGPGGRPAAGRPARRRAPGSRCSAPTGSRRRCAAEGWSRSRSSDDAEAMVTRLRTRRALARHHAGRGADPGRAAVGGQQHRPDHPDGRTAWRPATACWWRRCAAFSGVEPGWRASPSARCSTRPCAAWAANGR